MRFITVFITTQRQWHALLTMLITVDRFSAWPVTNYIHNIEKKQQHIIAYTDRQTGGRAKYSSMQPSDMEYQSSLCISGPNGRLDEITPKLELGFRLVDTGWTDYKVQIYYCSAQGRWSLWDRGDMSPPNIYEGGTSMVMSPQYFRSDVV